MHGFLKSLTYSYPRALYPLQTLFRGFSPQAVDLLSKLLTWTPQNRLTVTDALRHGYLR